MRALVFTLLLLVACTHAAPAAPAVPEGGTRIYVGVVFGPEGSALFRYTRDSREEGRHRTSIHRSYDADSGALVVAQAARHDADYALIEYVEDHRQLGTRSVVSASAPDRLEYVTRRGSRVRRRSERIDAPAVTGPTLFGFVAHHWDELARGEALDVRFVAAERLRSFRFVLHMTASQGGRTTVEMRPRSRILRLGVTPMRMTFATRTRTIVAYEGRIPPRVDGRPVVARVEYRHHAAFR